MIFGIYKKRHYTAKTMPGIVHHGAKKRDSASLFFMLIYFTCI